MAANPAVLGTAPTSRIAPPTRSLEQKICAQLLALSTDDIARAIGKDDTGTASRIRSGERSCSWMVWTRLMDFIGYKLVSKDKLCVPDYELRMLRDSYSFISCNPEMAARFSAWRESRPLQWDEEGVE